MRSKFGNLTAQDGEQEIPLDQQAIQAFNALEGRLMLLANMSGDGAPRPPDWIDGAPIWGGEPGRTLPPWSVFWRVGTA